MISKEWFGGGGTMEYWGLTVEERQIIPSGVSDWTKYLDVSRYSSDIRGQRTASGGVKDIMLGECWLPSQLLCQTKFSSMCWQREAGQTIWKILLFTI